MSQARSPSSRMICSSGQTAHIVTICQHTEFLKYVRYGRRIRKMVERKDKRTTLRRCCPGQRNLPIQLMTARVLPLIRDELGSGAPQGIAQNALFAASIFYMNSYNYVDTTNVNLVSIKFTQVSMSANFACSYVASAGRGCLSHLLLNAVSPGFAGCRFSSL